MYLWYYTSLFWKVLNVAELENKVRRSSCFVYILGSNVYHGHGPSYTGLCFFISTFENSYDLRYTWISEEGVEVAPTLISK